MTEPVEVQTCPRRMHEFGSWPHEENLDSWTAGHGMAGQDATGLSCSFCGSLNPDRFMELIRMGWVVGPTDKNYKAYLHRPLTGEEEAERKASWLRNFSAVESRGGSPEQTQAELEAYYEAQVAPTQASTTEAKFYYQHLSIEQQTEFIALYNERRMRIGYPGHLYVLPFFAAPNSA